MIYRILADIIVMIHLGFILFVMLGGLLVLKYPRVVWVHLPLMIWGAVVEFFNIICPLTPLENYLRELGGGERYHSDFVEKYIIPVIYPEGLTIRIQFILGCLVVFINLIFYSIVIYRYFKKRRI
ncbi:MAG: DUF2784 domain-containing protein [Bacteroidota bacterium]|nr:DUF2784 domain-containing protein [Bacteroidota bacterium]